MSTHHLLLPVLVADRRAHYESAATGHVVDVDRVRLRRRGRPRRVVTAGGGTT